MRYDTADGSLSLPEHRDTSAMSFSVALNPGDGGAEGEGGAEDRGDGGDGGAGGAGGAEGGAEERGGGEYAGGGTWFEALGGRGKVVDAAVGHAVAFAGPLRHAGYPIRRGTRYILVLFLYVEGFPYGRLCEEYDRHTPPTAAAADCAAGDAGGGQAAGAGSEGEAGSVRPSGDAPGGFVVYKQTTELVKMLNKPTPSVLD